MNRKTLLSLGIVLYSLFIVCFCFTPQPQLPTGVETPGIQTFGRLVFLLTPFNSLWKLGEVTSPIQLFWIFLQKRLKYPLTLPINFPASLSYTCTKKNEESDFV